MMIRAKGASDCDIFRFAMVYDVKSRHAHPFRQSIRGVRVSCCEPQIRLPRRPQITNAPVLIRAGPRSGRRLTSLWVLIPLIGGSAAHDNWRCDSGDAWCGIAPYGLSPCVYLMEPQVPFRGRAKR
jgi:hypothetical protein